MLTLIQGAEVWAPEPLGERDLLLAGSTIAAVVEPGTVDLRGVAVDRLDARGCSVVPGFVDSHVHILGGGGEGGPATRAPELAVEDIVACGVTGVIGCLGTDAVTRHPASLLAKARALEAEGLSAWIFTGSYQLPPVTLTGSVRSDLVLIDKVVGAGEIAISDHRSSQPAFDEIARLAAECRVGGMLGGKAGVLHLHLGDGPRGLELVRRLLAETEIPATQVVPTHCCRNPHLLAEAVEHVLAGGCADFTAGFGDHGAEVSVVEAVRRLLAAGASLERVTVSSDAGGSIPVFDAAGELTWLEVARPDALLAAFRALVREGVVDLAGACRLFAANPARIYRLRGKGRIGVGADADLVVLDSELRPRDVFARGRRVVADGQVIARSTFAARRESP